MIFQGDIIAYYNKLSYSRKFNSLWIRWASLRFNSKLFNISTCDLVQPTQDTQRTDFIQVFINICRDKGSDVSQNNLLFFQIVVIISLVPMWQYIFWNEFWCWRISSCVTWRNTVQLLSFIIGKWKRITLIY